MDFLFDNPFVLVIVAGIISSIYKNYKSQQKGDHKSTQQPKPFVPTTQQKPIIDFEEVKKAFEQTKHRPAVSPEMAEPVKENAHELELKRLQQQLTQLEKKEQVSAGRLSQPKKKQDAPKSKPMTVPSLQDAVVWAEILGPPRAKRPFRK